MASAGRGDRVIKPALIGIDLNSMEQLKDLVKDGELILNKEKTEYSARHLLAFPTELLVYVLSFLTSVSRDLAKMRYVSRKFRTVCQTPSLWRNFSWSQFDVREGCCVKNVLKKCGKHVKRLSFSHHVNSSKLIPMLKYCCNIVQLSIPTTKLNIDQLGKVIEPMRSLKRLDVPWYYDDDINPLLLISARLKELTIREKSKKPTHWPPVSYPIDKALHSWMDKWVKEGFQPPRLNVVSIARISEAKLIDQWVLSNPSSPPGCTGYLNVYRNMQILMDFYPTLPEVQLQFGQSCTLPFVKASKCGLLGLENDLLSLTSCVHRDDVLHRARIISISEDLHLKNNMTSLTFITHFDVSQYKLLHSGHLEQLAIMCPNLQHLNLKGNINCLKSLQGLRVLARCGKLEGLNLFEISYAQVENYIQLWEVLVDLQLIYLAIEICVLLPSAEDDFAILVGLYQNCSNLRRLESVRGNWTCDDCNDRKRSSSSSSLLLSHFSSLTHCIVTKFRHLTLQNILSSCGNLKCLRYSDIQSSSLLPLNCAALEQLCIESPYTQIPDSFMNIISAHGGLVHVVLYVYDVTTEGIATLITNSPKLETYHIYSFWIHSPEGRQINLRNYNPALRKKFSKRKLFTFGSCYFTQGGTQGTSSFFNRRETLNDTLLELNTDLTSLLP